MTFFGIDLGTSTCSVSYAVNSPRPNVVTRLTVVEFPVDTNMGTKSPAVPSIVTRADNGPRAGEVLYGFEAKNELQMGRVSGRNGREVFRSVKSHLGTGRSYVRADPSLNTPVKVWAELIRRLCEATVAAKDAGFDPRKHPTTLTVPASFGNAQRDETLEAARLAGFDVGRAAGMVNLIDEPVAALIDYLNHPDCDLNVKPDGWNTVLVFDFGGGTCDLVVLKFRYDASQPTGIEVQPQSISPYQQIGGDTIDAAILEDVVWPQVCRQNRIDPDKLSATERRWLADQLRYNVCERLKVLVNASVAKLPADHFQRQEWSGISASQLLNRCHDLKENALAGVAEMSASKLDEVMNPFLETDPEAGVFTVGETHVCVPFSKLVALTTERAGLDPNKLDLVLLHGGSCLSPFVPRGFEAMKKAGFLSRDCKIVKTPDLVTSVSRGAALYDCLSKKYGKPYIPPIVPEDMSIQTVGRIPEYVAMAGDRLPFKKAFDKFFLSAAGQQELVIPIYIGYDAERRRLASTLTIPIAQKNLPQSHPVEVELEIDADKLSRWRFRPKGYGWSDTHEVANPWIGQGESEEAMLLLETRAAIRTAIDEERKPTVWELSFEAVQTARMGSLEEGLALIEDVVAAAPKSGSAWNFKGQIHGLRRERQQSLDSYKEATTLDPTYMTYQGNYGVALLGCKRAQEAIAVMRDALSKDPTQTYLHSWLANAFQLLQNVEEMNKELEMCHVHARRETVQRPDDVSVWEEFRSTALRIGRYDDAETAAATIQELRRLRNLLAGAKHG